MIDPYSSEDAFLESLLSRRVRVYLVNGVMRDGTLERAFEFSILLRSDPQYGGALTMLFKSSITTVSALDDEEAAMEVDPRNVPGVLAPLSPQWAKRRR